MSGSGASNLGYGNVFPNSNVNPSYVNIDSSTYNGGFGSNQIPGFPGLHGDKSNVAAAAGVNPLLKGGFRRKIKNITKMYKMKGKSGKSKVKSLKKKIMSLKKQMNGKMSMKKKTHKNKKSRKYHNSKKMFRGGYSQYQNNLPYTNTYSTGGVLSASNLGLANPVPYQALSNCTNCKDNYNHFTGTGSPSRGH